MIGHPAPPDPNLMVLLIDDLASQAERVRERLAPYRIQTEWRASYRAAAALLGDPETGQLFDLVLIDQSFDGPGTAPDDLLTASEIAPAGGVEGWDVRIHQGLYILTRLSQDVREGTIPFVPMMILTDHARVELDAQAQGLGVGYLSKRRLLGDPVSALRGHLRGLRAAVDGGPAQQSGRPPRLAPERLAAALEGAWLSAPEGWLRVCELAPAARLDDGFEGFTARLSGRAGAFGALLAARAEPACAGPATAELERRLRWLRREAGGWRPLRLARGGWTVLGCWHPAPPPAGLAGLARAAAGLAGAEPSIPATALAGAGATAPTGADPAGAPEPRRGLRWSVARAGPRSLRLETWRDRWEPERWPGLLKDLAWARDTLHRERPAACDVRAFHASDGAGRAADLTEDGRVERVGYQVAAGWGAVPLSSCDLRAGEAGRRRLAAAVLKVLSDWERAGLAYGAMGPGGLLRTGDRLCCDLVATVAPLGAGSARRQRRGAAACLVLLLAPWPYAWPEVLAGRWPDRRGGHRETSAWGIAAAAVATLLEAEAAPGALAGELRELAGLLVAAARLDHRFPAWPAGLAPERSP